MQRIGVRGVEIRKPEQLQDVTSLIIPGGESTTMAKLAEFHNLSHIFLLNCDVCCNFPLQEMLEAHKRYGGIGTILVIKVSPETANEFGELVADPTTNELLHYTEKPETFVSDRINCGVYVFTPDIFTAIQGVSSERKERVDKPERGRNDFLVEEAEPVGEAHSLEDVSDVSDSIDCAPKLLQADFEDRDSSPVNWDTDTSEIHPTTEANSSEISGISFVQNGERKSPSVMDDSSSTCSTDSLPSVIANGPCKGNSLLKQNSEKSRSRGKNERVKATGCAVDTYILPSDTSDAGQVVDTSGICKVAAPEKAVSNSLQHRTKLTEQVAKKVLRYGTRIVWCT